MTKSSLACAAALCLGAACAGPPAANELIKPVYNKDTGKLEQLTADRDHDGKIDTRAYMDGTHLKFIEIDRNNDGVPDRWEYYTPARPRDPKHPTAGSDFDNSTRLERAEEANGPDARVTRREFYVDGVIARVEEDTDFDGKVDKWEVYEHGALARMDLDLHGRGTPDRRFIYGRDGALDHVEIDPTGTGDWKPAPVDPPAAPSAPAKRPGGLRP